MYVGWRIELKPNGLFQRGGKPTLRRRWLSKVPQNFVIDLVVRFPVVTKNSQSTAHSFHPATKRRQSDVSVTRSEPHPRLQVASDRVEDNLEILHELPMARPKHVDRKAQRNPSTLAIHPVLDDRSDRSQPVISVLEFVTRPVEPARWRLPSCLDRGFPRRLPERNCTSTVGKALSFSLRFRFVSTTRFYHLAQKQQKHVVDDQVCPGHQSAHDQITTALTFATPTSGADTPHRQGFEKGANLTATSGSTPRKTTEHATPETQQRVNTESEFACYEYYTEYIDFRDSRGKLENTQSRHIRQTRSRPDAARCGMSIYFPEQTHRSKFEC